MNPSVQTTYNDLAKALTGLTIKPAKKARDTSLQAEVMAEAHKRYRLYRDTHTRTMRIDSRWQNVPASYSAADFAECLIKAWNFIKAKRTRGAWNSGKGYGVVIDEATFQSCRTDGMLGW